MKREKKICGGYSQPNNSMKTHRLKYIHDRRREKRYMMVTCMQPNTYIKQFNENSPAIKQ